MNTRERLFPRWVLVLPLLFALGGCGSDTLTGPSAIQDVVWKLATLRRNSAATVTIAAPDQYTAQFLGVTVAVKADCNACSGGYTLNGAAITIAPMACTRVACAAGSYDQDYLAVLQGAQTHGVKDDVLTISSSAGELTFKH